MQQINIQFYKTPYTEFILGSFGNKLCLLDFRYRKMRSTVDARLKKGLNASFVENNDSILDMTRIQIDEYFSGHRHHFDIPLLTVGSPFQKNVWDALQKIPYGETSSYLQLSKSINKEKAVRAVASANGANAIALMIPCHRIIGSNGDLVGYGGGLDLKKRLLALEKNTFVQNEFSFSSQ